MVICLPQPDHNSHHRSHFLIRFRLEQGFQGLVVQKRRRFLSEGWSERAWRILILLWRRRLLHYQHLERDRRWMVQIWQRWSSFVRLAENKRQMVFIQHKLSNESWLLSCQLHSGFRRRGIEIWSLLFRQRRCHGDRLAVHPWRMALL